LLKMNEKYILCFYYYIIYSSHGNKFIQRDSILNTNLILILILVVHLLKLEVGPNEICVGQKIDGEQVKPRIA